jgi:1-aminocyclopropane-1-carboxylate deaminase/D-cysteine desulfhydrase-like pyridoxal-dependent ACC family enzyme
MPIDLAHTATLTTLPTPLEEAPRLSLELGAPILVKRDDLTGLGLGGNKVRKLDYLMRDALDRGARAVVTAGGAQSNFARMTAAAATRLGMACHLVLAGDPPARETANIMLDRMFGAELEFAGTHDWAALNERVRALASSLGADAYPMPIGGATPVGSLGYVGAAQELLGQLAEPPDWVVHASSSGGTQAGLLAGLPGSVRVRCRAFVPLRPSSARERTPSRQDRHRHLRQPQLNMMGARAVASVRANSSRVRTWHGQIVISGFGSLSRPPRGSI